MTQDQMHRFAAYMTRLRKEQKLSIRGLADKAGMDSGALTRIEQGKVHTPRPETLRSLASALQVPLADLFLAAGYAIPYDLPSMTPYLQARYGHLPEETLAAANDYFTRLVGEHDVDPNGPDGLKDEIEALFQ